MPIANVDLFPDQYADFYPVYLWTAAGTPVDLTNATARMMVRQNPGDTNPLLQLTSTLSAVGQIILGGTAGTVQIKIIKGQATPAIALVPSTPPHYDLLIDWPGGITTELMSGQFIVNPGFTH